MKMHRERFWLNGAFVPESEARISLLDRGLLFGDALYEVVRFYHHKPFLLKRHVERLFRQAQELALPARFTPAQIADATRGLVARSEEPDGTIYLQWTRGAAERGRLPPARIEPNLFAIRSKLWRVPARIRRDGAPVIVIPDERWRRTHLKTTNLLASVLARSAASAQGAFEALLYRGRGKRARLTEGTFSSLFVVRRAAVTTPRVRDLLPGITREIVLGLAREEGMRTEERTLRLEELFGAAEAFLTSTTLEILPIATVDGRKLRIPPPGPITRRLKRAFSRFRRRSLRETEAGL